MLFDELQLDRQLSAAAADCKSKSTVGGGREKSTSEAVLRRLSAVHRLPALVLQYRQVLALLPPTYLLAFWAMAHFIDRSDWHGRFWA